jgi:single-strand DNA-binding protein
MSDVTIVGNIGDVPELRYTTSGKAVARIRLAEDRIVRSDGEEIKETLWWNVTAWGSLAENAAESLDKGTRIIVSGRLKQSKWQSASGETHQDVEIVANALGPDLKYASARITRNDSPANGSPANGGHTMRSEPVRAQRVADTQARQAGAAGAAVAHGAAIGGPDDWPEDF